MRREDPRQRKQEIVLARKAVSGASIFPTKAIAPSDFGELMEPEADRRETDKAEKASGAIVIAG